MARLALVTIAAMFTILGCGSAGTKHDLDALRGKIHMGMSELEVTRDAGAPTHIDVDGDERKLRYEAKEGSGYILVTLRQGVVIDVERKE